MSQNDGSIIRSFAWKLLERGSAQIITLIVQIVLARILVPDEFGVISILLVFINVANVFIQKGFASSLIRKPSVTNEDYDTAFVVSEIIALSCVGILCIFSRAIENFYSIDNLSVYMRVLSITLIFGALYSVQNAELVRRMRFKQIFYRSMAASLGSGIIGIVAAVFNFGVWSLILQSVSQQIIVCIATAVACDWKPRIRFSKTSFEELFSFGSKILVAEIISIGVENLRTLIIGKKYSASDLAYYDRGQVYPATAMRSIYDTISSVLLPVFSKIQDEKEKLEKSVSLSLELSIFLIAPLFIGFATVARPFILVLLTEKWEKAIPFIVIFCIYQISFPAYGIFRQSLYALGKSNDVLKLEIVRSVIFIFAIIIGIFFSTKCIAMLSCASMYITTLLYYRVLNRYIEFNGRHIIKSIATTGFQCLVMAISIRLINFIDMPDLLMILIDIVAGAFTYIGMSIILKNESFRYCVSFIKKRK